MEKSKGTYSMLFKHRCPECYREYDDTWDVCLHCEKKLGYYLIDEENVVLFAVDVNRLMTDAHKSMKEEKTEFDNAWVVYAICSIIWAICRVVIDRS
ncbi:MAG: hypothetical protein ABIG55_04955 [Candidatus Omnitrophota bacterium]|nr:hypothetical protein [Candidatus Omnitrophota bacterium]